MQLVSNNVNLFQPLSLQFVCNQGNHSVVETSNLFLQWATHNLYSSRGSAGGTDPVIIPYRIAGHKVVHVSKVTICPHLLLNFLFNALNLLWYLGLQKLDYSGTPLNGHPSSNSKHPQYNFGSQWCPLLRGSTVPNTPMHNLVPQHSVLDRLGQRNKISAFWDSCGILNHAGRQSFWNKIICNQYQ